MKKELNRESRCSFRDSKQAPTKYHSESWLLEQIWWVPSPQRISVNVAITRVSLSLSSSFFVLVPAEPRDIIHKVIFLTFQFLTTVTAGDTKFHEHPFTESSAGDWWTHRPNKTVQFPSSPNNIPPGWHAFVPTSMPVGDWFSRGTGDSGDKEVRCS